MSFRRYVIPPRIALAEPTQLPSCDFRVCRVVFERMSFRGDVIGSMSSLFSLTHDEQVTGGPKNIRCHASRLRVESSSLANI